MKIEDFYQLMENPALLSEDTLPELKHIIDEFPYFQTARSLYLKNLSLQEDLCLGQELKRMAVYIPDRKKLFILIEGDRYGLKPISRQQNDNPAEDKTISAIDEFLSVYVKDKDTDTDLSFLLRSSATSDYMHWSTTDTTEENKEATPLKPLQHQGLIDAFIQQDEERGAPRFLLEDSSDMPQEQELLPEDESREKSLDDSYFTETLAQIYIKQKRYEKALQIIKNLRLNYPEKSIYFADQIRFLEKLIINTKK